MGTTPDFPCRLLLLVSRVRMVKGIRRLINGDLKLVDHDLDLFICLRKWVRVVRSEG